MEEKKLNLDELDNVFGGVPQAARDDLALEHPESYRQKMIEDLKKTKESLEQQKREMPTQSRNR